MPPAFLLGYHHVRSCVIYVVSDRIPNEEVTSLSPEDILTVDEAATLLSLHPDTVRRLAREGRIPAGKLADQWRFSRRAMVEWIEKGGEGDPVKRAERYVIEELGITPRDVQKGAEWPQYECPECGLESLVDTGETGDNVPAIRYRCFNSECEATWRDGEMKHCPTCGQLRPRREFEEGATCKSCWEYAKGGE